MVVEQGPLFETGGSTSHAPGLVFQLNPSKTMTGFARHSVDLWTQLELDGVPCAKTVGSLEVAWTPERLVDLRRKAGYGLSWGVEAHLLSPAEARDLVPMLSEQILGALYVPSDVHTRATRPAEAMAREAERNGASFHGKVRVSGLDVARGRIRGVRTTHGDIRTDLVIAAAGIWAPTVGELAGVPIPLSPMQHLYAVTTPIEELAGATEEISQPMVRHQDAAMYFRQEGDCYGIGSYRHEPLLVEAGDLLDYDEASIAPAELPFIPKALREGAGGGRRADAESQGRGFETHVERHFLFYHGRTPGARRVAPGQGVLVGAGGLDHARRWRGKGGRRVDCERRADQRSARVRHPALPRARLRPLLHSDARAAQQYREVYDIIHPRQQIAEPRNLRLSPFRSRQCELGAAFFESDGWERPEWYEANQGLLNDPLRRARARCGMAGKPATGRRPSRPSTWPRANGWPCLTSHHLPRSRSSGPASLAALQRLTTNQMDRPVGTITYTPMLTPQRWESSAT